MVAIAPCLLDAALAGPIHAAGHLVFAFLRARGPMLLAAGCVPVLAWLLCGRGLRGGWLALWLLVPEVLLLALLCFLGPGHLFPKNPFEGPVLVEVSRRHALTALDLIGLAYTGLAALLGAGLVWARLAAAATPPAAATHVPTSVHDQTRRRP